MAFLVGCAASTLRLNLIASEVGMHVRNENVSHGWRDSVELINLPQLQRQNLTERVTLILKHFILSQQLNAGDHLPPERQLAEILNVSRTVLRESLSQLIGEGILQRTTPRKLSVADFDRARLAAQLVGLNEQGPAVQSLVELRVFVELGVLRVIAERLTESQLAELQHWVELGELPAAERPELGAIDINFHTTLLRAANNPALESFLPIIEELMRQRLIRQPYEVIAQDTDDNQRVVHEHRQIYEALARHDATTACQLLFQHLQPYLEADWREQIVSRITPTRPAHHAATP